MFLTGIENDSRNSYLLVGFLSPDLEIRPPYQLSVVSRLFYLQHRVQNPCEHYEHYTVVFRTGGSKRTFMYSVNDMSSKGIHHGRFSPSCEHTSPHRTLGTRVLPPSNGTSVRPLSQTSCPTTCNPKPFIQERFMHRNTTLKLY